MRLVSGNEDGDKMSYDIYLKDPITKETIEFDTPHQMKGGTYCCGGTNKAWLNITYNYSEHYDRVIKGGIRGIYGMTGAESIPVLIAAIANLADDVDPYYWKATEGNAKRALVALVAMAKLRPDGIFEGD